MTLFFGFVGLIGERERMSEQRSGQETTTLMIRSNDMDIIIQLLWSFELKMVANGKTATIKWKNLFFYMHTYPI